MAKVDVGLPIPLGNYSYLPPVQTGMNDAEEEKAMNPLLAWLASQAVDVAAEETGVKPVLRERGAGLLNLLGIGDAQAAESPPAPPVDTGFKPKLETIVAKDAQMSGGEFGNAPADIIRSSVQGEFGNLGQTYAEDGTPLYSGDPLGRDPSQFRRPDVQAPYRGRGRMDPSQYDPIRSYIESDDTPPANVDDEDTDKVLKDEGFFKGLWNSTLGDEEWRTRKAMILNSMRLNPDAALTQAFASRIKDLRANKRAMKLADQLEARGDKSNADLLRQYPEAADTILKALVEGTGTSDYKNYQFAVRQGFQGSFMDYLAETTPKQYESTFDKLAQEWGTKRMGEAVDNAENAKRALESANRVIALVEEGRAVTGSFAEVQRDLAKLFAKFGNSKEAVQAASDTELLEATLGSDVFPLIKTLGIGARGLDTENERKFLLKVMTGEITMTPEAIAKMARIRKDFAEQAIDKYNKMYDSGELRKFGIRSGVPLERIEKPKSIDQIRQEANAIIGAQ